MSESTRSDPSSLGPAVARRSAAVMLAASLLSACTIAPARPVPVYREMPAPVHEMVPPPPGPGAHWVPGHWSWREGGWRWNAGHYVMMDVPPMPIPMHERVLVAPRPGMVWVRGHWFWGGNRWVWAPGVWVRG